MVILYVILAALAVLLLLLLIAVIKTLSAPALESTWQPSSDPERDHAYAEKLAEMVKYETVSYRGMDQREKFLGFHNTTFILYYLSFSNYKRNTTVEYYLGNPKPRLWKTV